VSGCCDFVGNGVDGNGEGSSAWTLVSDDVQTLDGTVQLLRVGALIVDSGVKVIASVFGVQVPVGSTFGYDFIGIASRAGGGSGAGQYGDETSGVPVGWMVPVIAVDGAHVVTVQWAAAAATVVNWSVHVLVQRVGGATA